MECSLADDIIRLFEHDVSRQRRVTWLVIMSERAVQHASEIATEPEEGHDASNRGRQMWNRPAAGIQ